MNEQEQAELVAELKRMLGIAQEQADYIARLETQMEHLQANLLGLTASIEGVSKALGIA
jgi:hypothetical protein